MEPSSARYIEFQGKTIEVDEEGFLKSDKDWSEELAIYLSSLRRSSGKRLDF